MTRLLLVLAAVALLLLPGAANAAGCSPLNCAPSQFTLSRGMLVAYRHSALGRVSVADLRTGRQLFTVPGGFVGGNLLVHRARSQLTWFDLRTGAAKGRATLPSGFELSGVSQSGSRAAGFRTVHGARTIVILSPHSWRQVPLPKANWDFDALYASNLFLIKYLKSGAYEVYYVDLSTDSPEPKLIKDPHESGTIWGSPFSRTASPNGHMLFTLYIAGNGAAMVHELNLATPAARCIDLPGTGDYGSAMSWAMALSPNARTLWAVSPGYGRAVGIDVATRKVTSAFRFDLPAWNMGFGTRIAMRSNGQEVALASGQELVRLDLDGKVLGRISSKAVALGWSPTGLLRVLR